MRPHIFHRRLFYVLILLFASFWITPRLLADIAVYKHLHFPSRPFEHCRLTVGDLNGDGRPDYLFNDGRRKIMAVDHNGNMMWEHFNPDDPGVEQDYHNFTIAVYDIDQNGLNDVICFMEVDGANHLAVLNGADGAIKASIALPYEAPRDHERWGQTNFYMQQHIAIANLRGLAVSQDILAIHASKLKVAAYHWVNGQLALQWYHVTSQNAYATGHYAFPYDLDGDGRDEVIAGVEVLDAKGNHLWAMDLLAFNPDNPHWGKDHLDACAVADIDPDNPGNEIIAVAGNGTWMYDKDGNILWHYPGKRIDPENGLFGLPGEEGPQEVLLGNFRPDIPGLEMVIYDEIMGGENTVAMFDCKGNVLVWKDQAFGPRRWVTALIDWDGNRSQDMIYSRLGIFDSELQKVSASMNWGAIATIDRDEFPPVIADMQGDHREEIIFYDEDEIVVFYNPEPLNREPLPSPWLDVDYQKRCANANHCSAYYLDWTKVGENDIGSSDLMSPNPPRHLTSPQQTESSISLSWAEPLPADDGDIADCYCIFRDGSELISVTSLQYQDTGLQSGVSYRYEVVTLDKAANASTPASLTVSTESHADTTPPNAARMLGSPFQTETEISLEWQPPLPASDGETASTYKVFRNGTQVIRTGHTRYLDTALDPATEYHYAVYAVDEALNVSVTPVTMTVRTHSVPQRNTVLQNLNASVSADPVVRTDDGGRFVKITVNTTQEVAQVPPPLALVDANGKQTCVTLSGPVPGSVFSGLLEIADTIAHGEARFELPEGSLVSCEGLTGLGCIVEGGTIFIDQIAPQRPTRLVIGH